MSPSEPFEQFCTIRIECTSPDESVEFAMKFRDTEAVRELLRQTFDALISASRTEAMVAV